MRAPTRFSLPIRVTHWLNAPLLGVMVWSGILIYWANPVYWPQLSSSTYSALGIDHRLAEGMAYHFSFAWAWTVNGLIFFLVAFRNGEIKSLLPNRADFKQVPGYVLQDLGLRQTRPSTWVKSGKFNPAQRIAYFVALIMGALSLLTGLSIHKPVQLHPLASAFGGYEKARLIHYALAALLTAFTFIHVMQVIRAGWSNLRGMVAGFPCPQSPKDSARSRRAFLALLSGIVLAVLTWQTVRSSPADNGLYTPLRKSLEANGRFWSVLHSRDRIGPVPHQPPNGARVRINGDLGLDADPNLSMWRLEILSPTDFKGQKKITFTLQQISWLPRTDLTAYFRCIEGWSEKFSYEGIRFTDFMKELGVGTRSGRPPDPDHRPEDLYRYVGLETPDGRYYVSIDMESMLHPQTLLATHMNSAPLTQAHGSPLRLVIPIKYGIKSLKQVGRIRFSDTRPPDYWAERGYDWYAGL